MTPYRLATCIRMREVVVSDDGFLTLDALFDEIKSTEAVGALPLEIHPALKHEAERMNWIDYIPINLPARRFRRKPKLLRRTK